MRLRSVINPAYVLITIFLIGAVVYACNKSNGYGSSNNGGSTGNNISIRNFAFSVSTLTVSSGTAVKWTNNDATAHTVTADDSSFNSGELASGQSFTHTFDSTGTFAYHCTYHPVMTASVVVK